jgi:hypothetical protein
VAVSPPAAANVRGAVVFAWTPNASLGPNQLFELVFWEAAAGPDAGRALNAASASTTVQINVDNLAPGPHNWGIFLAQAEPYTRIRYLGGGGAINVDVGGGSDGGGGNGNSNNGDDGTGGKPGDTGEKP